MVGFLDKVKLLFISGNSQFGFKEVSYAVMQLTLLTISLTTLVSTNVVIRI